MQGKMSNKIFLIIVGAGSLTCNKNRLGSSTLQYKLPLGMDKKPTDEVA
jgi:hypothetical protein